MTSMRRLMRRSSVLAVTLVPMIATLCAAAQDAGVAPPQPGSIRRAPAPWIGLLVMLLLVAVVVSINLIPSKRSHQD